MSDSTSPATPAPEDTAVPVTPATPAAPADVIDALLAFAAKQANNPLEQQALAYAQQIIGQHKGALASALGASGPLTVKGVVDQVFAFVEGRARRPFVRYALQGLNLIVDDLALPALQVYLATLGIVIPLS